MDKDRTDKTVCDRMTLEQHGTKFNVGWEMPTLYCVSIYYSN
ncbi:hypothetical protein [Anabaena catenula]|nr:hypothetical protein [Anabaena catenula]